VSKSQLNRADVNIITIGDNNVKFTFMLYKVFPEDTNTSTLILFLHDFAFAHATMCSCIRLLA
jgi:hypothetical protein